MSAERIRIALHDYGGHPFTAQLSRTFADRGHETLYLHAGGLRQTMAFVAQQHIDAESRFHNASIANGFKDSSQPR